MAKGRALCLGVDDVRPVALGGDGPEAACAHQDAAEVAALARACGFGAVDLLTTRGSPSCRPTLAAFKQGVAEAARELSGGDTLLLTFAGHGAVRERAGGFDEAWCLEGGLVVDDDLTALLATFEPDVRVWIISDSCYSGTMVDPPDSARPHPLRAAPAGAPRGERPAPSSIARAVVRTMLWRHQGTPLTLRYRAARGVGGPIKAAVLCLSACLDKEQTRRIPPARPELPRRSFTRTVVDLWGGGRYPNNCWQFCHDAVGLWVPDSALRPQPYWVGSGKIFGDQTPAFPIFAPALGPAQALRRPRSA
jgi:hypothetical protein